MVPKGCARLRSHLLVLGNSDNMHVYGLLLLVRINGLFVCHHESLCHVRAVRATNPHGDRPNVMKRRYQIPLPNPSVSQRQLKTPRAPNAYEGNSSPNSSRPKDRKQLPSLRHHLSIPLQHFRPPSLYILLQYSGQFI